MTAKEEKIREAYGEYWESVKDFVNENGWIINAISITRNVNLEMERWFDGSRMHARPKSLQGIENNNGWIKIESEDDLPKETDTYFFVSRHNGKIVKDYFTADSKVSAFHTAQFKLYSHYQPIKKPKPPIY